MILHEREREREREISTSFENVYLLKITTSNLNSIFLSKIITLYFLFLDSIYREREESKMKKRKKELLVGHCPC